MEEMMDENTTRELVPLDREVARLVGFVRFTNEFRRVRRLIWYKGMELGDPERNGEHAFQLALVAWFIRENHQPHLDLEKLFCYSLVHDLPETHAGDTPAFPDKQGRFPSISRTTKRARELRAMRRIEQCWKEDFPEMIAYLKRYDEKADEESRFIYALDKFLSDLNIFEDNGRTNIELGVTFEDQVGYKRPRIAEHDFMLGMYDKFIEFCSQRPELHPQEAAAE